ncbi:hypothetical protein ACLE20_11640 [Rhizobium sp. YIM 134829]|uniref:hypothetical protein n=1 Tax=Rhizobium sp. YIM 134829 TaxID=3390453 RepID=UPI00397CD0AF
MRPVEAWDDTQLANLIANYRRLGRVDDPAYLDALSEMARRKGGGLNFEKTFNAVVKAAKEGRFLSYKQLAEESDVEWSRVRYAANQHLRDLLDDAHRRGWPLLSAIIVNQHNLQDGHMEPSTLRGFCEAARALGYAVADEEDFLKDQQKRVFEWAATYQAVP